MRLGLRASLSGYVVAILAVMAIAIFREALRGVLVDTAIFIPFISAVMISAWYGGLKPGLQASAPGAHATAS